MEEQAPASDAYTRLLKQLPSDGLTKNNHFQHMVHEAAEREFSPELTVFESWYSGFSNLQLLRDLERHWLIQLKSNREVSLNCSGNRAFLRILIPIQRRLVHLNGYR